MQLFERGYFQLDDPVSRFFPEWSGGHAVWIEGAGEAMKTEPAARPISFRDLLTHTAGLTYGASLAALGVPPESPVDQIYVDLQIGSDLASDLDTLVRRLAGVPLRFQPGQRWMYSIATDVCGALIERISGQSLTDYFQAHIFAPLGMTDTAFYVPPEKTARFAANYMKTPARQLQPIEFPIGIDYFNPPAGPSGGGGLVGTMGDYMRFADMLRAGGELDGARIIGPRTLRLMCANHLKGGATLAEFSTGGLFSESTTTGVGFGLGLAGGIDPTAAGTPATADYYWGGAASTYFWFDPVDELAVVFMTQLMPSNAYDLRRQLKNLVYAAIED
jgi:CubicO group peptidase (beta-lactamase class C family)